MKKYFIFSFFCLFISTYHGQVLEGFFQYNIDVTAIDTSMETRKSVSMLQDSKMTIYFEQNKYTKIIFKMGMMFNADIIVDHKTNESLTLSTSFMGKHAIKSKVNPEESIKKDSSILIDFTGEEKTILGFKCKKAILKNKNSDQKLTYWYTNDINIKLYNTPFVNPNIPGFPLAFSTIDKGVFMRYQASNYGFELTEKEKLFSFEIPEGYTLTKE